MVAAAPNGREPETVGRYIVYGEIASGGMGAVHFGRLTGPAGFARAVAIKRLHRHFARDPEFLQMFLDEARLAARVVHPNVVATLDVIASEDDLLLVMEYVRGASLSQLVRALRARGERMPPLIATGIVAGVLHGLHAAHEAKDERGERLDIVHRDVSPQNILVGTDGSARVLDFGIAKAAGRLQVTREGQLKGKLGYMAPEQIREAPVTRRTDVYAATVVLWEILTGARLFHGDNDGTVLARVLEGDPPPPSTMAPHVPGALDRVVLRGLRRDPSERYATAREMAQALYASVGVASAAEIGDWVERVAAQLLEERAKRIAEIERDSARDAVTPSREKFLLAARAAPDAPTPLGQRAPEAPTAVAGSEARRRRARRVWGWLAVGATTVFVSAGASAITASRLATRMASSQAATAASSGESVATVAEVRASPVATATVTAGSPQGDVSGSMEPSAKAMGVGPAPAVQPTIARPKRLVAGPADCNPPFVTDEKGHVHFKAQCF
jgi:serine/threonine-protein kinase